MMSGEGIKDPFFARTLRAYKLASPFAMAVRTDNFTHCVEASLVGAKVLRDRTIEAKAIPCVVVGANMKVEPPVQLSLGLNARDIYSRLNWDNEPRRQSFEEWRQTVQVPKAMDTDRPTIHMAIEATYKGERAIVDSTIGQLRAHLKVSMVEIFPMEPDAPWPAFGTKDGWECQYEASPHAEYVQKHADGYKVPDGWVNDLDDLMQLAISCKLNEDQFFAAMKFQSPALFKMSVDRLMKLANN